MPETKYTKSGDVHIAYQVVGNGPLDLVVVPGWVSHLEVQYWEEPFIARFFERLARFSRLILFDKRGTGLSDRVARDALPTLEQRMEDVHAVMDAARSKRAALFGISEGGAMCALFAATYPERTSALVMSGCYAKWVRADDYPWAPPREVHEAAFAAYEKNWGTPIGFKTIAPSAANDERSRNWWARYLRMGASPGDGVALYRMNVEIDVRAVLPAIKVPTLVMHRKGDRLIDINNGRYLAEHIPGAKYVELEGADHLPWFGDAEAPLAEIEEFLTGIRPVQVHERMLATVLFADLAQSTETAAKLGDAAWRDLLREFHQRAERCLGRFRGRLMDTAGDGLFATFDGPARAVLCAFALQDEAAALGLGLRGAVHIGEVEKLGQKVGGIAVHIGARLLGIANIGEVVASSTVKDIVAGSGLRFDDLGVHRLKGIPDEWRVFRATTTP
jgi:pimeloyl-ACP methyl ester carboxylesterase